MEVNSYIDQLTLLAWQYGPKVLSALAILVIGFWVIRKFSQGFNAFMRARKIDDSLRPFFGTLIDTAMKVVLLLVVASTVGIGTTSFIAIFSAIAFAVGLALQGSLGNFASGVLILLFRPYKVGDHLWVADKTGRVTEIQIFNTVLTTPQGKKIIIIFTGTFHVPERESFGIFRTRVPEATRYQVFPAITIHIKNANGFKGFSGYFLHPEMNWFLHWN